MRHKVNPIEVLEKDYLDKVKSGRKYRAILPLWAEAYTKGYIDKLLALKIARETNTSAKSWLRMQENYDKNN